LNKQQIVNAVKKLLIASGRTSITRSYQGLLLLPDCLSAAIQLERRNARHTTRSLARIASPCPMPCGALAAQ